MVQDKHRWILNLFCLVKYIFSEGYCGRILKKYEFGTNIKSLLRVSSSIHLGNFALGFCIIVFIHHSLSPKTILLFFFFIKKGIREIIRGESYCLCLLKVQGKCSKIKVQSPRMLKGPNSWFVPIDFQVITLSFENKPEGPLPVLD